MGSRFIITFVFVLASAAPSVAWAGAEFDAESIPWSQWQGEETERDMMMQEERTLQDEQDDDDMDRGGWMMPPPLRPDNNDDE